MRTFIGYKAFISSWLSLFAFVILSILTVGMLMVFFEYNGIFVSATISVVLLFVLPLLIAFAFVIVDAFPKSTYIKKPVEEWIKIYYGERCPEYVKGCAICEQWKRFDELFRDVEKW